VKALDKTLKETRFSCSSTTLLQALQCAFTSRLLADLARETALKRFAKSEEGFKVQAAFPAAF
jgi:hypothetical protein